MNNVQKHKADFEALVKLGIELYVELSASSEDTNRAISFVQGYQSWYTEASAVVRQLLPERLPEFKALYEGNRDRKRIDQSNYSIQDWMNGMPTGVNALGLPAFDGRLAASLRFNNQLNILRSVETRFESALLDIRQFLQADLLDSELGMARELVRNGFLRAAGAVAGVALEKHLVQVLDNHSINSNKRTPTISDFNDLLKNEGVLDIPSWRQIQRLGDIRNLCTHNKERDPTKEEVEDLISGVDKYTRTLF